MNKIKFAGLLIAVAFSLSACGKDVPSCGEPEVTSMATQTIKGIIEQNVPDTIDNGFKTPVKLTVSSPTVESHDTTVDRYVCKAAVSYQIPEAVLKARQQGGDDKDYGTQLAYKWRSLMGLYSVSDVKDFKEAFILQRGGVDTGYSVDTLREELQKAVHVPPSTDDNALLQKADLYIQQGGIPLLDRQARFTKTILGQADANGLVNVTIHYTVAKVDGQQKFRLEAAFDDQGLAQGIRNVQVMESAVLIKDAEANTKADDEPQVATDSTSGTVSK